jgi:flagellar biosynthesis protein FlhG
VLDVGFDQAAGLRRLARRRPVQVIAVTSGKGGVGKTNVSVNLAIALAAQGKEVMLLDADLGLGNVDVMLGLHPRHNLSHVVAGDCGLEDIIVRGPAGVRLVPSASGVTRMCELDTAEHAGLIRAFGELGFGLDVLVVDTAAGASDTVLSFLKASQEIVVVVCDEPASITDAYALMKVLSREHGRHRFRILANMVRTSAEARDLFMKLVRVSDRFLSVTLDFMGTVPYDETVHKAVRKQRAVSDVFPRSRSALAFKKLAAVTDNWPVPDEASGQLEFFVERLIQAGRGPMEVPV